MKSCKSLKRGPLQNNLLGGQRVAKRNSVIKPALARRQTKRVASRFSRLSKLKIPTLTFSYLSRRPKQPFCAIDPVFPESRRLRLNIAFIFVFIGAGIIVSRLYSLQATEQQKWLQYASNQYSSSIEIAGARGTIVDTVGRTLAASVESIAVGVHPKKSNEKLAKKLADILNEKESEITKKLKSRASFVWLARGVPLEKEAELRALETKGVSIFRDFRRYYPQGQLAGALLGRVSREGKGQSGIELMLNDALQAEERKLSVKRDARGRFTTVSEWKAPESNTSGHILNALLSLGSDNNAYAAEVDYREEGAAVQLTIDSMMQNILEEEFLRGHKESKAKTVYGLVMDAYSGEILALGQTPGFNPNTERVSPRDLRNIISQNNFEPGSTLKPLVAAAALDAGVVRANESMDCLKSGRYPVGPHIVRDAHPVGRVNFSEALVRSSNICMAKVGQRLGEKRLHKVLVDFGFGKKTGANLPGEASGILRDVSNWREIDVATHSFGQGIAVTAVQLVRAYSALANGGMLVLPKIVHTGNDGLSSQKRIISEQTAKEVSSILEEVTTSEHGTGKRAAIPGLRVAGKTGTAQKAKENGHGYDSKNVLSSFIGFVDGSDIGVNRTLTMLVVVDEPGVNPRWGGTVAAPIFRRSMKRMLSYLMANKPISDAELRTAALKKRNSLL